MLVPVQTHTAGLAGYFQLLRPHQWTKNVFCLAGVFFSGHFQNSDDVLAAFVTFACFCAASSATYIFNDLLDRERDSQHPLKCRRPLASGAIRPAGAIMLAVVLAIVAIVGADWIGRTTLALHQADAAATRPGQP